MPPRWRSTRRGGALVDAHVDGGENHALGHCFVQRIFRAGSRSGNHSRITAAVSYIANTHRLYGLPWGVKWTARGESVCRKHAQRLRAAVCRRVVQPASSVPWQPDQFVANALFADGAAAMVVQPTTPNFTDDAWQIARCAIDRDCRFRGYDELANQRSRLPNEAFSASAGVDRPQLATLARLVAQRTPV